MATFTSCIPLYPHISIYLSSNFRGYLTVIYSWPCTLCIFMYFSGWTSSENGIMAWDLTISIRPGLRSKYILKHNPPQAGGYSRQGWWNCEWNCETSQGFRLSPIFWWFCRIKGCCGICLYHRQIVLVIVLVIVSRFLLVKLDVWWNLMSDETGLFLFPTFWHNSIWLSSLSWSCPEKLGFNQRLFLRCSFSLSNPIHPKFRDPKINRFNNSTIQNYTP